MEDERINPSPRLCLALKQSFAAPKRGRTESEYEDAWAASSSCLAVADGASESSFAAMWAKNLVERFVEVQPSLSTILDWLKPLQNEWSEAIGGLSLPWYAEEKAQYGAFSTLAGLKLCGAPNWSAIAVGDSCVFHVRRDELLSPFPLSSSGEFGNTPVLISSKPVKNRDLTSFVKQAAGTCELGDHFFLATDALARWCLTACEAGSQPWPRLLALEDHDAFLRFLDDERAVRQMQNDDVTLLTAIVSCESANGEHDVA